MWVEIGGMRKNYKSLSFTVLRDELIRGVKTRTFRTSFIPNYQIGEEIAAVFKSYKKGEAKKEVLFVVPVENIYPKQIKDITEEEAKEDGFLSVGEMQAEIFHLNNIESEDHWGFFTCWDPDKRKRPDKVLDLGAWMK